jgi:AbrB family looped-hinge helix DNA binding protein
METTVSSKGQVVLPSPLRRQLGIRAGDHLDMSVEAGSIVLTPQHRPVQELRSQIIADPITGFPVLTFGPDAPILTSEEVAEMLADFP